MYSLSGFWFVDAFPNLCIWSNDVSLWFVVFSVDNNDGGNDDVLLVDNDWLFPCGDVCDCLFGGPVGVGGGGILSAKQQKRKDLTLKIRINKPTKKCCNH